MKTLILLLSLGFVGCNAADSNSNVSANKPSAPSPTVAQYRDGVRRVTTAELADLIKQGKVLVVDVRNKDAYDRGHIPDAKLLPLNEVGERGKELPRDRMIVTYCS